MMPLSLPVTVCAPDNVLLHELAVQLPFVTVNVVAPVTSPIEFLKLSKPAAVYAWLPPAVIVALAGLRTILASAPGFTVRVNVCVASGGTEFVALIEIVKVPAVVAVPAIVAVPLPRSIKLTPAGKLPVSLKLGVGVPLVMTVNDPAMPAVNVALLPLVICGGVPTTFNDAVLLTAPVPPSFDVIAPVVLFLIPVVVPVTLTEIVHELFPVTVPPDKLIDPDPATAVVVPLQVVVTFGVFATTKPTGSTSVKPTPVKLFGFELEMVKVRLVLVFRLI
jgi:hypothetical protein